MDGIIVGDFKVAFGVFLQSVYRDVPLLTQPLDNKLLDQCTYHIVSYVDPSDRTRALG